VATLPRRFGDEGVAWARLARGDDPFIPPAFVPGGLVVEALELEAPLDTLEPLLFALKRLLDRVELRLRARGAATTRLRVRLALDDGSAREIDVVLAHPFRAAGSLLRIARARLQPEVLAAPVVGLVVAVLEEAPLREASADLFRRGGTHEEGVAELIARLSAALGEPAVFAARPRDVHRPEDAWEKLPYSLSPGGRGGGGEGPLRPLRPLRLLEPPEPARWEAEGTLDRGAERATSLQWRAQTWPVEAFAGPERLQGEWWLEDALDRDYYTLQLGGGQRLWLYEDTEGAFHVHGVFE
jgi:protein ImuB